MKSFVLASILAAGVFTAGGVILLLLRAGRSAAEDPDARASLREVRERLGDLTSEMSRLAQRLDAIERRAADSGANVADLTTGAAAEAAIAAAIPGKADSGEEGAGAAPSRASLTTAAAREALSSGDPASAAELRHFVAQVIREDREERQRKLEESTQARVRQWKELHEGPYGTYNFRVNSLAQKLGLTDAQKEYYHRILQEYEPRFRDLRKDVKWTDAESREVYQSSVEQIQKHFENTVKLGLTPEQRTEYESLPTWERGVSGGAQVFVSGGDVAADVLTAPLPVPGGDSSTGVSVVEFSTSVDGGEGSSGRAVRIVVGGADASEALPPPAPPSPDSLKGTEPTKPAPTKP